MLLHFPHMLLEAVKDLSFGPWDLEIVVNNWAEASAHQPILEGGVHCYLEGQARPHLQEAKLAELRTLCQD